MTSLPPDTTATRRSLAPPMTYVPPRGGDWTPDRAAVVALVLLALVAGAWILYEGRGLIFFFDEWDWLLRRRQGLDGLFAPHNGHFSLVPVAIFKLLFATVGVEPYWVYRLVSLLVHLLCVALLFAVVRRRHGPGVALAAATMLLALGSAWQVFLILNISFSVPVAAGLGALLALDAGTRKGDLVAAALVLVALASSGLGLPIAAGVLAELILVPAHRRRVWVALAPLALYACWFAWASPQSQVQTGNIDAIPHFVGDAASGSVGAVTGLGQELGRVLLVLGAVFVVKRLLDHTARPARLVGVLTMGLAYWMLLALARAQLNEPLASRYLYFGGVVVLLLASLTVERAMPSPRARVLIAVAVGVSVLSNLGDLRQGSNGLRGVSNNVRAGLAALELAGAGAVPASTQPAPTAAPQVAAGPYRALVADLGSPVGGPSHVLDDGPATAVAVDAALAAVLGISAQPSGGESAGAAPPVAGVVGGRVSVRGSCVQFVPTGANVSMDLKLRAGSSVVVRDAGAAVTLRLRRMAADFSAAPLAVVEPQAVMRVALPRDALARPWVLRVAPASPLNVCTGLPT